MAATATIVSACSPLHLQHMVTAETLSYTELCCRSFPHCGIYMLLLAIHKRRRYLEKWLLPFVPSCSSLVPACFLLHLQHMVTAETLSYAELSCQSFPCCGPTFLGNSQNGIVILKKWPLLFVSSCSSLCRHHTSLVSLHS